MKHPSMPSPVGPTIRPAFIRLPKAGQRDPFTGLSRTALFELLRKGKVKSISMKQPGNKRGIRLIDADSLVAAINAESGS